MTEDSQRKHCTINPMEGETSGNIKEDGQTNAESENGL
jgi:hypothetical protein